MSQDYHYQIVVGYDGKYPQDEHGHLLDLNDMSLVEGHFTEYFPQTIKGQRMVVQRKGQKRWVSPREVAKSHTSDKTKLGRKRKFHWAKELTNPYGSLHFGIGSGDDFFCFDYDILDDGRAVIHCVINSETGSFIMDGGYEIVPKEDAPAVAMRFIDDAVTWCAENDVKTSNRGWNQDPFYFYRCVFLDSKGLDRFTERQRRFGGKKINKVCGLEFLNAKSSKSSKS